MEFGLYSRDETFEAFSGVGSARYFSHHVSALALTLNKTRASMNMDRSMASNGSR
jgi:hypothetical protein